MVDETTETLRDGTRWVRIWLIIATIGALCLALNQVFNLSSSLGITVLSIQFFT